DARGTGRTHRGLPLGSRGKQSCAAAGRGSRLGGDRAMSAPELLAQLRALDVRVWAEGERVRLSAPRGRLTAELRSQLAAEKEEILSFLRTARTANAPATAVVAVQRAGAQPPFFAVPGHNGDVFCYVHLSRHLGA